MRKGAASKAALALVGAAVIGPMFQRARAQEIRWPAVRSHMLVSTAWLEQHLNDADLVVLYVGRNREKFDAGHISGAVFVWLDDLVEQRKNSLNELPPVSNLQTLFESLGVGDDANVVLTGDANGMLAARAYFTLDYLGHGDRAALLDGGAEKWMAESRKVSRDEVPKGRAHFTPRVQPELLVTTAQMRELSAHTTKGSDNYVLLDARPVAEYEGVVPSEAVPKAGHIAGAQSLYWKTLIRSDANPQLLAVEDLRQQFTRAGAVAGDRIVTYCRTGMQSSFTYFVAKYLGYHTAMYDGSVYEWVHEAGNDLVPSPRTENRGAFHQ